MEKLSLAYLVEQTKSLSQEEQDAHPELIELAEVANQLLKGKIDQAARFRAGLKAHIEALDAQREYASGLLDKTEDLMEEAVRMSGGKKLEGSAWTIAIQKAGGKAAIVVDDDAQIPPSCHTISLSLKEPFSAEVHKFFMQVALKKEVSGDPNDLSPEDKAICDRAIRIEVSKTRIGEELKRGVVIPGVREERGEYLKVTPGKVKPAQIEG